MATDDAFRALAGILGCDPNWPPDLVFAHARQLVADRTPDTTQLLFDAVPAEIPRAELDRRIVLALRQSEYERVRDLKLTDLADALAERDERQACIDAATALAGHQIAHVIESLPEAKFPADILAVLLGGEPSTEARVVLAEHARPTASPLPPSGEAEQAKQGGGEA